jgi:hypothetical protein
MLRLRWLGLCLVAVQGLACSGEAGLVPGDSSPEGSSAADASVCMGPFEEVSTGCAATYDGTHAPPCARGITGGWIERCDGHVTLIYYLPAFQLWCSYDETSHALVGAAELTDVPDYCNHTSIDLRAGNIALTNCPQTGMNESFSCVPIDADASGSQ